ncbi:MULTISPECIES: helix-turn-helix transcriptional regulator [unclassified Dietzia]|uniref:helix-turn-helix transcriptional regulator n=1 Tax=unclassified Dietzia TaxID=2617939 RepID=UPI000D229AFB|nr:MULTISPECIES: helix-turn-helix transcriptional regulator [unclassified Dietzia]AVZ38426.1 hypothetical protein CT688_01930 [Dietzia sp. JS16-p6b]
MQQHLRENLSDSSLSVAASSAALFMSVRYVQKVFAQAGTTPMAWLVDCRIGEARRLLGETSLPIGEVARMVGYRDTAQFSRSFKSRTGCSPSAFRGGRSTSIS